MLQFGRALSGAETPDRPEAPESPPSFNSAAPSQARRPRPPRRPTTGGCTRFNSAAPSQARRLNMNELPVTSPRSRLQFGRALSGAETQSPGHVRLPEVDASIRPRPLRRGDGQARDAQGSGRPVDASIRPRPLRRGDWATRPSSTTRPSFNSAAPSQARRLGKLPVTMHPNWAGLQFGRALSGAETRQWQRPWPRNRGFNSAAPSQARRRVMPGPEIESQGMLQFGRALSGAETRSAATGVWVSGRRFNSAAPSQARRQTSWGGGWRGR